MISSTASVSCMPRHSRRRSAVAAALAVLILASLLLLTSCNVQSGVETTVNTDGTGTVGMRLVADKELQDALAGATGGFGGRAGTILGILGDLGALSRTIPATVDDLFNLIIGQIPGDWQAERGVDSSGNQWLTVSRSFTGPEELQQILSGKFLSTVIATDELSLAQDHGFFGTKTVYSATGDAGSLALRGRTVADYASVVLGDVLTIENRVTLPGSIKDNNADEVRGNALVWSMDTPGARDMYAESVVYNLGAVIGIIVLGVVIIAGAIVTTVCIIRRRRRPGPPPAPAPFEPPSSPPPLGAP